jgi:hypothetical protein
LDRVAVVAWLWFIGWIAGGWTVGKMLDMPGTGAVCGFILALLSVFTWPWVMPRFIDDWMHDLRV